MVAYYIFSYEYANWKLNWYISIKKRICRPKSLNLIPDNIAWAKMGQFVNKVNSAFVYRGWVPKFATGLYIIIKSAFLFNFLTRIDYKHKNQFILNFSKALEPILLGVYWEFTLVYFG